MRVAEEMEFTSNDLQRRERCFCDPAHRREGKWHVPSSLLMGPTGVGVIAVSEDLLAEPATPYARV